MIEPAPVVRSAIHITIRTDLKKRYDFFIAWLKMYHADEGSWTQNTAMDEILKDSPLWRGFLEAEKRREKVA